MTTTVTLDKAGRLVIPRAIREKLHFGPGTRLNIEALGDRVQLSEAPAKTRIARRSGRRVIAGWEGFDAAEAVNEMRNQRMENLETSHDK